MINWIFELKLRWTLRKLNRSELVELNCLITKAARRCAYDLKHACSDVWMLANQVERLGGKLDWRAKQGDFWADRAQLWLNIFDHTHGGKNYRHELHSEIRRLESLVEKYEKHFTDAGLEVPFPKVPF